jgi:hypothetical protein
MVQSEPIMQKDISGDETNVHFDKMENEEKFLRLASLTDYFKRDNKNIRRFVVNICEEGRFNLFSLLILD